MSEENSEKKNKTKKSNQEKAEEEHITKITKPIVLKAEAYKTIILYASRYANKNIPSKDWKEIYGILIGYSDDELIYVESAEALTVGHDTDVQLDARHYVFIDEIQQKLDKESKNHYMVGWFHSHPGLGLFYSYIDLINQLGFQQNNLDFCGLVFDHTLLGKKREENIISEDGSENKITKHDTGFEIYRLIDVNMDVKDPKFEDNYEKVDCIINGLNKFFFANVLSELSALVSVGKPLQSAYGEYYESESNFKFGSEVNEQLEGEKEQNFQSDTFKDNKLVEIPPYDKMIFDVDDFFYDDMGKKLNKIANLKEEAEQIIYEGTQAFERNDAFMGVEKYRLGINKYKKLNDTQRIFELLKNVSEHCISTNHLVLAEEFAEELFKLAIKADKNENLFYKAEANFLKGYINLKKKDDDKLEYALKKIQEASIDYEKAGDYAGAGKCYHKIGTIYQSRLNRIFNACLFYIEGLKNHNEALLRGHPLRKSLWSKPELLTLRILEIKDIIEDLISNIENPKDKKKIRIELNSIKLNI